MMRRSRTGLLSAFLSISAARLISAGLSFLLIVYVARALGPSALGVYSLILGLFVVLQYVPVMGLHIAITRSTAASPAQSDAQLVNGIVLAAPIAGIAAVAMAIIGQLVASYEPGTRLGIITIGLSLIPTAFTTVIEAVLVGREQTHRVALVGLVETICRTLGSLIAIYLGFGVEALFVLFALGRVLAALAYAPVLRSALPGLVSKTVLRQFFSGIPVFFSIMALAQLMERMDHILLGSLTTAKELGIYAAPYKLYELLLMAPRIASLVLLPRFASRTAESPASLETLARSAVRVGLVAAVPISGVAYLLSNYAILIFGQAYAEGAPVLAILSCGFVGVVLNIVLSIVLIVTRNQKLDLVALIAATFYYAVALFALVPPMGALGAAIATASVSILQPLFALWLLRLHIDVKPLISILFRVAFAGSFFAGVAWLGSYMGLALCVALSLLTFLVTVLGLNAVSRKDFERLLRPSRVAGAV